MKTILRRAAGVCIATGFFFTSAAFAAFTGPYAVGNGDQNFHGGNGIINLGGAPNSFIIRSANGPGSGGAGNTDFFFTAAANGTVSFDWAYLTADTAASRDPFRFVLNGNPTLLMGGAGTTGAGSYSTVVAAGDTFGWRIRTTDGTGGRGSAQISNFSGPVPEPETYLMMAIGAAAMAYARRRQQKNKAQVPPMEPASA